MPSIEIVCVEQKEPIECSSFSFAIESDKELISDRAHSSSFQCDFDSLNGCIYHLLGENGRNAYDLLKKDWYKEEGEGDGKDDNIDFLNEHDASFIQLINTLMDKSPVGKVIFTSDYQFGPESFVRLDELTLSEFLIMYKEKKVRMNSLYVITKC